MADEREFSTLAKGLALFSRRFLHIANTDQNQNYVSSPLSLYMALCMVRFGAVLDTAVQMSQVLGLNDSMHNIKNGLSFLCNLLKNTPGVSCANKIYICCNTNIDGKYIENIIQTFGTEIEKINFTHSDSYSNINCWVENKTHQKIKSIIAPSDINENTRVLIINTLYFKGSWQSPFNPKKTKLGPFYCPHGATVDAQFMNKAARFLHYYSIELDADIIQIPYANNKLSLIIILPKSRTGLFALENSLINHDLSTLLKQSRQRYTRLQLPKFTCELKADLSNSLKKLGMNLPFDSRANFANISKESDLKISKIVQKTFIEVNESGTIAAAATCCLMTDGPAPPPLDIICDHGFVFRLVYIPNPSDVVVLFGGSLRQP
jgi:serine protease inhibitor